MGQCRIEHLKSPAALAAGRRLVGDVRGVAAVELAFAVPVLVILLVAVINLGRAIQYHEALADGSRAALRYLTRVEDPCNGQALDAAVSLAVTRSLGWSTGSPQFADWPTADTWPMIGNNPISGTPFTRGTGDFEMRLVGCTEEGPDPTMTLEIRHRYTDIFGLLDQIGHGGGFWISGRHQERFVGA